jgi:transposase
MKDFQNIQLETLEYIGDEGYVSAGTISEVFDLSLENSRRRLRRYADKGWLEIKKFHNGKNYKLSGNGFERLKWLKEKAEEAGERFSFD